MEKSARTTSVFSDGGKGSQTDSVHKTGLQEGETSASRPGVEEDRVLAEASDEERAKKERVTRVVEVISDSGDEADSRRALYQRLISDCLELAAKLELDWDLESVADPTPPSSLLEWKQECVRLRGLRETLRLRLKAETIRLKL
jgi:hypothetical protein